MMDKNAKIAIDMIVDMSVQERANFFDYLTERKGKEVAERVRLEVNLKWLEKFITTKMAEARK